MKFQCQYCLKELSNKSSLNNHLSNAKYCISKRNIKDDSNVKVFKCCDCNKSFTSKQTLNLHELKCIEKLKKNHLQEILEIKSKHMEEINTRDLHIKELESKLENIALKAVSKPTTVNNNNSRVNQIINNLTPITTQHLTEHAQFLTLEHIKDGASGYAKYALEYPLKDKIICVDYARKKVKYKDEEGNLVDDPEMTKLAKRFFTAIETYNNSLLTNYNAEILQKMLDVGGDNNEMTQEEADKCILLGNALFEEMVRVKSIKTDIEDIKKGNKPELYYDFVKDVCSKTTC
jgi:hypothetical protein